MGRVPVAATAHEHGQAAGIQPSSTEQAKEWTALGYNLISYSVDFGVYQAALKSAVEELRG